MPDPFGLPMGGQRIVIADRSGRLTGREVVIPSLRGHPDALPERPSPYDKSFERQMPPGYTVTNAPTAWDVNKTVPGHLYVKVAPSVDTFFSWPSPPAPFVAIAKLAGRAWYPANANHSQQPGLMISTNPFNSGSILAAGLLTMGDGTSNVRPQASAGSSVSLATSPAYSMDGPIWYALKVNSASSVDSYFSFDGRLWTLIGNLNPGFTPGTFGLRCRQAGANPTGGHELAWAYVRIRSSLP